MSHRRPDCHCGLSACAGSLDIASMPRELEQVPFPPICVLETQLFTSVQKVHLVVYLCVQKLHNNLKVQRNKIKHDISAAFTETRDGVALGTLTSVVVAWIRA